MSNQTDNLRAFAGATLSEEDRETFNEALKKQKQEQQEAQSKEAGAIETDSRPRKTNNSGISGAFAEPSEGLKQLNQVELGGGEYTAQELVKVLGGRDDKKMVPKPSQKLMNMFAASLMADPVTQSIWNTKVDRTTTNPKSAKRVAEDRLKEMKIRHASFLNQAHNKNVEASKKPSALSAVKGKAKKKALKRSLNASR